MAQTPAQLFDVARMALIDSIKAGGPAFAALQIADGYAAYFVGKDGRIAGVEYADDVSSLEHTRVSHLAGIAESIQHAETPADEQVSFIEGRFLSQATEPRVRAVVEEVLAHLKSVAPKPRP